MKRPWPRQLSARLGSSGGGRSGGASRAPESRQDDAGTDPSICCRRCGHPITRDADRISIDGQHRHVFANPAGHVYDIGCFAVARNLGVSGEASSEFTWFAGYQWQVAACGQCGIHLGWRFSASGHFFFGLILDRLSTGPSDGA